MENENEKPAENRFVVHVIDVGDLQKYFGGEEVCICDPDEHTEEACRKGHRPMNYYLRQVVRSEVSAISRDGFEEHLVTAVHVIWENPEFSPGMEHEVDVPPDGPDVDAEPEPLL